MSLCQGSLLAPPKTQVEYYQAVNKFSGETCGHHHRTRRATENCIIAMRHKACLYRVYRVVEAEGYDPTYFALTNQ